MYGAKGSQVPADYVMQFSKVVSSSVTSDPDSGESLGLLFNVAGAGGFDFSGDVPSITIDDDAGERSESAEVFGALGIMSRPLAPETVKGRSEHADVACIRTADGLVPVATRDTRLRMGGNAPSEGQVALVGYGGKDLVTPGATRNLGGFISMTPNDSENNQGTIETLYCPYDFDSDGVAQKAHSITLDPSSPKATLSIVHSSGMAITMSTLGELDADSELVIKNTDGAAYINLKANGKIDIVGSVTINGSLVVGNPTTAVPLLAGAASPPCSTLFVSP
ncbi:MAG: hypothetical protein ACYS21_18055 [Planctomycetota bacterium]|jgi:hypothetical protein